jgi:hypothetical protein
MTHAQSNSTRTTVLTQPAAFAAALGMAQHRRLRHRGGPGQGNPQQGSADDS